MAKTKRATKASSTAGVNLERLTQSQASWLIGKPAVWLRDNAHIGGRNGDGSYNARDLVYAVRAESVVAELPDEQLEFVIGLAEEFAYIGGCDLLPIIRFIERLDRDLGAAGLAAIGAELLRQCRAAYTGPGDYPEKPTPESIREKAEAEVRALDRWNARRERRVVVVCEDCKQYRWGRQ